MTNVEAMGGKGGVQVIARAASILRVLKAERDGLSLGQIATRVDLPRSTVQRIVAALESEHLVIAAGVEGGVRLGPELQALAEAARTDIVEIARPFLLDLSRATGETVDLAVPRGDKLIFIDKIPGTQRLRAVSSVGEVFPLTTTANGKACLALMGDDDVRRLARAEWKETRRPRDLARFLAEIREARATGVAFDEDEHTEGISAVGAAFRDAGGDIHALSVPAPTARFRKNRAQLVREIKKTLALLNAAVSPRRRA